MGDEIKEYIDEEDVEFGKILALQVKYEDVNNAATDWEDLTIDTIGKKINSYVNPAPTVEADYKFVRDLFYKQRNNYIDFLARKFHKNSNFVRNKLDSWTKGTGIAALFKHYYSNNPEALLKIKRMQINKYHTERGFFNEFSDFYEDLEKQSGRIW